jgi:hypothetical protein
VSCSNTVPSGVILDAMYSKLACSVCEMLKRRSPGVLTDLAAHGGDALRAWGRGDPGVTAT